MIARATRVEVRLLCGCGRPLESFALVDGVLRPSSGRLAPAGPNGRREEYRWRVTCTGRRCRRDVVVRGQTIYERALRALNAGRVREVGDLTGRAKEAARRSIERGDYDSWEQARQWRSGRRRVDLVVGVDI